MSVIIRGMKMPKNCTECPFFIKSNSPKYPFVDCKIIGRLGSVFNCIGIPVDCPLVELPPHGRLIDADELTDRLERRENNSIGQAHAYYRFAKAWVDEGKTVIEAEAGSGGGGDHAEEV